MAFLTGEIAERSYQTEGEALMVDDEYLADWLSQFQRKFVYCCYAFSDKPIGAPDLLDISIKNAEGDVDAELENRYSDITGYLWTDEDGKIGGHDILSIFYDHRGKYGAIVVDTNPIDLMSLAENWR